MNRTRRAMTAGGVAFAIGAGAIGAAAALGGSGDDAGDQVTGPAADRAERAALQRFPGARATSVERDGDDARGDDEPGDGDGAWEVEIMRSDGERVEVDLDERLRILAVDDPK